MRTTVSGEVQVAFCGGAWRLREVPRGAGFYQKGTESLGEPKSSRSQTSKGFVTQRSPLILLTT